MLHLTALYVQLWVAAPVAAFYDIEYCNRKTRDGETMGYWHLDEQYAPYSKLSESTFYVEIDVSEPRVTHQKLSQSLYRDETVLLEVTPDDSFWVFLDKESNTCIYKKNQEECVFEIGECTESAMVSFGVSKDRFGRFIIDSEKLAYTSDIRSMVTFGASNTRGIMTTKIGICSYRKATDETVVSYLHILNDKRFQPMYWNRMLLLTALVYTKKFQGGASFQRIDFTDYKLPSRSQRWDEFSGMSSRCGDVGADFTARKPPQPRSRFGYSYVNQRYDVLAKRQIKGETPTGAKKNVYYNYSWTSGDCQNSSVDSMTGGADLQSAKSFWGMDSPKPVYLGVYENRGIQCDLWQFEGTESDDKIQSINLYTATRTWLSSQGKPKDMFYPVERIVKSNTSTTFEEIHEFKEKDGPYLSGNLDLIRPSCSQHSDFMIVQVTLGISSTYLANPSRYVKFQRKFRNFLMDISGILSPSRISFIHHVPISSDPEQETVILIRIDNNLSHGVYKTDHITSKMAAEKIQNQVNQSILKFTIEGGKLIVTVKKGSFSVWGLGTGQHDGVLSQPNVYSATFMSWLAMALVCTSFALSTASMFVIHRWRNGVWTTSSMGMRAFVNDA